MEIVKINANTAGIINGSKIEIVEASRGNLSKSNRKITNKIFSYGGHLYRTDKLHKPSRKSLILLLWWFGDDTMIDELSAIIAMAEKDKEYVAEHINTRNASTETLCRRLNELCKEWLGYPNECAYTDSIFDVAVDVAKKIVKKSK